jgi:hypothetical protein
MLCCCVQESLDISSPIRPPHSISSSYPNRPHDGTHDRNAHHLRLLNLVSGLGNRSVKSAHLPERGRSDKTAHLVRSNHSIKSAHILPQPTRGRTGFLQDEDELPLDEEFPSDENFPSDEEDFFDEDDSSEQETVEVTVHDGWKSTPSGQV